MIFRLVVLIGSLLALSFTSPTLKAEHRLPSRTIVYPKAKPPLKNSKDAIPLIILDAGHGGNDEGAKVSSLIEKKITLSTTLKVKRYLERLGYRVLLTRSRDIFISLQKRTFLANKYKGAIFVSIHYNSAKNKEAHGVEVFYCDGAESNRMKHSKKLAQHVLFHLIRETGARSRGIKGGNLFVIRETKMPSILVEAGFITNPEEGDLLLETAYLEKIAKGIAEGVDLYFQKEGNRPRRELNARPAA